MDIVEILEEAIAVNASDIHILIDKNPSVRVRGEILPLQKFPILSPQDCQRLIYSMLTPQQIKKFELEWELDCSFELVDKARFRVNVLMERKGVNAVLRVISTKIPMPEEIKLTPAVVQLTELPRGLVLVTGPTGSGKSTTLASLINVINKKRKDHILTIEDPIEYIYEPVSCVIRQREVGTHTQSFAQALKHALREDPDIILVGEMRDLETISLALTAAETGHLVFATLHTTDAAQTVDRIVDVFPPYQQQQIRVQLSGVLKAVVSQILLPHKTGKGRVAAREIMIVTPAISNLIREGKTHQIYQAIETGGKFGMISLDRALVEVVKSGDVSFEEAVTKANNPEFVKQSVMSFSFASTKV